LTVKEGQFWGQKGVYGHSQVVLFDAELEERRVGWYRREKKGGALRTFRKRRGQLPKKKGRHRKYSICHRRVRNMKAPRKRKRNSGLLDVESVVTEKAPNRRHSVGDPTGGLGPPRILEGGKKIQLLWKGSSLFKKVFTLEGGRNRLARRGGEKK